jgi:hypothetical protein
MMNGNDNHTPDIISKTDVLLGIGVALLTATFFKQD